MPNDHEIMGLVQESLGSYEPEGYDPTTWEKGFIPKPPPPDGDHAIVMHLAEAQDAVRIKPDTERVVATIIPKFLKPDGTPGQFLNRWWPSTYIQEGSHTSSLATVALAAGNPFTAGMSSEEQMQRIWELFRFAGEAGIKAIARTRWVKSILKAGPNGAPTYKDGREETLEVKGQKAIENQAIRDAMRIASENGLTSEAWDLAIADARLRTHIYFDPVTNEEKYCRAEINFLTGRYQ